MAITRQQQKLQVYEADRSCKQPKNKFLIACSVALRVMQKDTSRDEKTVSILVPSVASSTKALIPNRISETLLIFKNVLHGQERPNDERYYIISFHIYELIFV